MVGDGEDQHVVAAGQQGDALDVEAVVLAGNGQEGPQQRFAGQGGGEGILAVGGVAAEPLAAAGEAAGIEVEAAEHLSVGAALGVEGQAGEVVAQVGGSVVVGVAEVQPALEAGGGEGEGSHGDSPSASMLQGQSLGGSTAQQLDRGWQGVGAVVQHENCAGMGVAQHKPAHPGQRWVKGVPGNIHPSTSR